MHLGRVLVDRIRLERECVVRDEEVSERLPLLGFGLRRLRVPAILVVVLVFHRLLSHRVLLGVAATDRTTAIGIRFYQSARFTTEVWWQSSPTKKPVFVSQWSRLRRSRMLPTPLCNGIFAAHAEPRSWPWRPATAHSRVQPPGCSTGARGRAHLPPIHGSVCTVRGSLPRRYRSSLGSRSS